MVRPCTMLSTLSMPSSPAARRSVGIEPWRRRRVLVIAVPEFFPRLAKCSMCLGLTVANPSP